MAVLLLVSAIRFAALPVGAATATSKPAPSSIFINVLIIVVLPVPGPPVIIDMLCSNEFFMASLCIAESFMSLPISALLITASMSAAIGLGLVSASSTILLTI